MWILVGLGNPGKDYSDNRHNIGFMAIDGISDGAQWFPPFKAKFQGLLTEGTLAGQKVILLKPQTYMNESGQSVGAAARFYKVPPERIIVFHDELDLPPGTVRVKKGGGNAGHNGLKSIEAHLNTPDFYRVRLGIGHPGARDKVTPYVLGDFAKTDAPWLERVLDGIADASEMLVSLPLEAFAEKVTFKPKEEQA